MTLRAEPADVVDSDARVTAEGSRAREPQGAAETTTVAPDEESSVVGGKVGAEFGFESFEAIRRRRWISALDSGDQFIDLQGNLRCAGST
jgi:hypothetical protein